MRAAPCRARATPSLIASLTAIVAAAPAEAEACSCEHLSTAERFETADVVFEGTIVTVHGPIAGTSVTPFEFEVEDAWKGVDVGESVVVHSSLPGTCGPGFEAAASWIVFGHRSDGGPEWALPAGAVGGSPTCGGAVSSENGAGVRAELDGAAEGEGCAVDRPRGGGPMPFALMILAAALPRRPRD